jgi:hypothetical protein
MPKPAKAGALYHASALDLSALQILSELRSLLRYLIWRMSDASLGAMSEMMGRAGTRSRGGRAAGCGLRFPGPVVCWGGPRTGNRFVPRGRMPVVPGGGRVGAAGVRPPWRALRSRRATRLRLWRSARPGGCSSTANSSDHTVSVFSVAAPSALITSPASGGAYSVGEAVPTSVSCTEGASGPGIVASATNGASDGTGAPNTATAGPHTYLVTATSKDGQVATTRISYMVRGRFIAHTVSLVRRPSLAGARVWVRLGCQGAAGETCSGPIAITTHVRLHGKVIVAVAAATSSTKGPATKAENVARSFYRLQRGHTATFTITLNRVGKGLLAAFYRFFRDAVDRGCHAAERCDHAQLSGHSRSRFLHVGVQCQLHHREAVDGLPRPIRGRGHRALPCGGCPFKHKRFIPHRRDVSLTSSLDRGHLAPGTAVTLRITAPERIGKVIKFAIRGATAPTITKLCLPPGTNKPARCR